jgi:ABC-type Zn uptake system ZnuABC Zn-binding protein ZnuA
MKQLLLSAMLLSIAWTGHAKVNVVATLPDLGAMARDIGGDKVNVTVLGKPAEDPHYIQPKPSLLVALNKADLLIENGLDLEVGWLPSLLEQTRNRRIRPGAPGRLVASDGISVLDVPEGPLSRAQGDVHPGGNPHYLWDPIRGKTVAQSIADALKRVAPADAAAFDAGLARLLGRIDEAHAAAEKRLAPFRGAKVVTYHKSLTYLAERYELVVVGTIEPKPGIPPSPAHLAQLAEEMKTTGVKVVLQEPWHEDRTTHLVAKRSGANVAVLPAQSGSTPSAPDYPSLIQLVAETIAAAMP